MQHTAKTETKHFDQQQQHNLIQLYELTTMFGDVTPQIYIERYVVNVDNLQ